MIMLSLMLTLDTQVVGNAQLSMSRFTKLLSTTTQDVMLLQVTFGNSIVQQMDTANTCSSLKRISHRYFSHALIGKMDLTMRFIGT